MQVGVGFLVEREGGWDTVKVWEDTLSLGEQQRIGMSRLFYHEPLYGVLDEVSSTHFLFQSCSEQRILLVQHVNIFRVRFAPVN